MNDIRIYPMFCLLFLLAILYVKFTYQEKSKMIRYITNTGVIISVFLTIFTFTKALQVKTTILEPKIVKTYKPEDVDIINKYTAEISTVEYHSVGKTIKNTTIKDKYLSYKGSQIKDHETDKTYIISDVIESGNIKSPVFQVVEYRLTYNTKSLKDDIVTKVQLVIPTRIGDIK